MILLMHQRFADSVIAMDLRDISTAIPIMDFLAVPLVSSQGVSASASSSLLA